jgi:hypothetical protein
VWTRLVEADGGARSWELVPIASSKCVSRGRRGRLEAGRYEAPRRRRKMLRQRAGRLADASSIKFFKSDTAQSALELLLVGLPVAPANALSFFQV